MQLQGTVRGRLTRGLRRWPVGLLVAALLVLVVYPTVMVAYASFLDSPPRPSQVGGALSLNAYERLIGPRLVTATLNSLRITLGGTAVALALGGLLAWLGARTDIPARWLVGVAGVSPLFISALVASIAWSFLGSPRTGYLNTILADLGVTYRVNLYSVGGMIFVFGIYYAPYSYVLISSAFSLMNPQLEEAAGVHGASLRTVARTITFPLALPAIAGSVLLTFILIFENFPVPQVLATPAGISTLPTLILRLMTSSAPPRSNEAAAVGTTMMVVMILVVIMQRRIVASRDYATLTGKGYQPRRIQLGAWRIPALAFVVTYVFVAVILPYIALFFIAFRQGTFITSTAELFDWSRLDFGRFYEIVLSGSNWSNTMWIAMRNSLVIGVNTAVFGTLLYLAMGVVVYRTQWKGRGIFEFIASVPLAVPALSLSMGFLWAWFALPVSLNGTLTILVLAYIARFMPQGFRGASTNLVQVGKDLEDSAVVAGASRYRGFFDITFPLIRPSVVSTAVLLLILSMRELTSAIFLFTSRTRVLSVYIFNLFDDGMLPQAAMISIVYSAILLLIVLASQRFAQLKQDG